MSTKPIVVTSGEQWVDIDAFACAVAYAELLQLQGTDAVVVIPGTLNTTIPAALRALGTFLKEAPSERAGVVIVDVSNPAHFASFVAVDEITDIFDHHAGHEQFWSDKLGSRAHIEMIGACATLIYEAWENAGKASDISKNSARLLAAAIASNTLHFQIDITCARDHHAFAQCLHIGNVDEEWITDYFTSCDRAIIDDLEHALRHDTKREAIADLGTVFIGQLELWKSGDLIRNHEALLTNIFEGVGPWFVNAPSMNDHVNFLLATDEPLKTALSKAAGVVWSGNIGTTQKLMLRKEILRDLHKLHGMG